MKNNLTKMYLIVLLTTMMLFLASCGEEKTSKESNDTESKIQMENKNPEYLEPVSTLKAIWWEVKGSGTVSESTVLFPWADK